MSRLFALILVLIISAPAKQVETTTLQRQLDALKGQVAAARDSLQIEIAERWHAKQQYVGRRETDKTDLDGLRETQEKAYAELARIKEENLAVQATLDDAKKNAAAARDGWAYLGTTVEGMFARAAEEISADFPLDREERRLDLEVLRAEYRRTGNVARAIDDYGAYQRKYLRRGRGLTLVKQTLLPDTGAAEAMTIARFGSVFGYGVNAAGRYFIIDQTGRMGAERFTIVPVSAPAIAGYLATAFPQWARTGIIGGTVPVDVMHNESSRILISGKRVDPMAKFRQWFRNGGPVMVPLALVALWAVLLFAMKLFEFARKQHGAKRRDTAVAAAIDNDEFAGAADLLTGTTTLTGRMARACLDQRITARTAAEQVVRKMLVDETPSLGRHINTLAVLATAAPLLGLLGTVTGMINLFAVLTQYGNSDPKLVAGGISEALVTTQAGMIIAIPIVLMHNYLRNRREAIVALMEKTAITILNKRWPG